MGAMLISSGHKLLVAWNTRGLALGDRSVYSMQLKFLKIFHLVINACYGRCSQERQPLTVRINLVEPTDINSQI
jgi:hypothetical protein